MKLNKNKKIAEKKEAKDNQMKVNSSFLRYIKVKFMESFRKTSKKSS